MSEWISVGIGQPLVSGWYLVVIADPDDIGWSCDRVWMAYFNESSVAWDSCDPVEDGQPVTHWMHPPEIPK